MGVIGFYIVALLLLGSIAASVTALLETLGIDLGIMELLGFDGDPYWERR